MNARIYGRLIVSVDLFSNFFFNPFEIILFYLERIDIVMYFFFFLSKQG